MRHGKPFCAAFPKVMRDEMPDRIAHNIILPVRGGY